MITLRMGPKPVNVQDASAHFQNRNFFPERRAIVRVKTISYLAAGVILAAAAGAGQAQTGFSLSVGSPGFYGAIDIGGGAPPPALVYAQPIAVQPVVVSDPLYLYVPPDQYANWGFYCAYYNACNRAVYFVDNSWYQRSYVPYYRSHRHVYERRRSDFDRHVYRPPPRGVDHRNGLPLRPDARRGPVTVPDYHRSAPPPRVDNRPQFRPDNRSAPAQHFEGRPQIRQENRSAPVGRPSGNPHSGQEHHRGRD